MTNHTTPAPTAPVSLTPEQNERLVALLDGAIFATTSWLISAVKHPCDRRSAVDLANLIESDRRLRVTLTTVAVTA